MNPYLIEGPAVVSFSGGRTSAFMLRKIADAGLRDDVHVLFADTGKEREETYDFVRAIQANWEIPIHWVSREGGFEKLIEDRKYLPNPVTRFCTTELKVRPIKAWMRTRGYEHWTMVVGIRADERHRARRLRSGEGKERWDYTFPMVDDGVSVGDVDAFWKAQPFDLQLRPHEGNCDLCFLKGYDKRVAVLVDRPDLAVWWQHQEEKIGAPFRKGQPIARLLVEADARRRQLTLPLLVEEDDLIDCFCGD